MTPCGSTDPPGGEFDDFSIRYQFPLLVRDAPTTGGLVFADRFMWFTPSWLLAVGVTVGLLILLALWSLLALVNRRAGRWCWDVASEALPLPLFVLGGLMALYAVVVFIAGVSYESKEFPYEMFGRSLSRLIVKENPTQAIELKPSEKDHEVVFDLSPVEVESLNIVAAHTAEFQRFLPGTPGYSEGFEKVFPLVPNEPYKWERTIFKDKNNPIQGKYFFSGDKVRFFVTNDENVPNTVTATIAASVEFPEVGLIPKTALFVVAGFLLYYVLRTAFPRMIAVASTTTKECLYQPLFYIVLAILLGYVFFQLFIPQNTFGDDVKPFKENTLTLLALFPIFLAVWTASHSIADEIEGRTALTVLSKPIGRVEFILGKYLGVMFPIVLIFCICGVFFLARFRSRSCTTRESANLPPNWQICFHEMRLIIPGLALRFMECMALASISVAISTRLPMLANLLISMSIYVLGHVLPQLVASNRLDDPLQIIHFTSRFFAAVLPVLENYTIDAAITSGKEVPWEYLLATLAYTGVFCAFALVVSLLMFEDRDLS
ncbi:MAG: ABC transporter permease subunit [Pirellulales bacterium]